MTDHSEARERARQEFEQHIVYEKAVTIAKDDLGQYEDPLIHEQWIDWLEAFERGRRSLEQERLPKTPDPALIDSMSMRYNHGFGLLSENQQEGIRRTMRQLYEEVSGHGFYHPGYKLPVHKGDS